MRKPFFDGVNPEDAFLDSSNLPGFDHGAAEGRLVRILTQKEIYIAGILFMIVMFVFIAKLFTLQVINSNTYKQLSENNRLIKPVLFAQRGVITDRFGEELAWNIPQQSEKYMKTNMAIYSLRKYTDKSGFSHLLGFVKYPETDSKGNWWRTEFVGSGGVEQSFNDYLSGENGYRLIEVDALRNIISSGAIKEPQNGDNLKLSIDAELNEHLHNAIKEGVEIAGFSGGGGIIMDIHTGEIISITSYPEFNLNEMISDSNHQAIVEYNTDSRKPFLNRTVQGVYTPGSIVKPFIGAIALEEGIITESSKILSNGVLKVPNPYYPGKFTLFRDWRAGLGLLNIKEAIQMSSNIFFYVIGGGFENMQGLGIKKIEKWAHKFGFGQKTGVELPGEQKGLVPNPEWKKQVFGENAKWNLGNTYHSAIGQYGWLVTPVQIVRYIASIANGGKLIEPTVKKRDINKDNIKFKTIDINEKNLNIIKEGMRMAATSGTARALNIDGIQIAAKTGTAQIGKNNEYMNSWVVGFWPYEQPRFAFAVVLEKAKAGTLRGAAPTMRGFFEWLAKNHANDYAKGLYPNAND